MLSSSTTEESWWLWSPWGWSADSIKNSPCEANSDASCKVCPSYYTSYFIALLTRAHPWILSRAKRITAYPQKCAALKSSFLSSAYLRQGLSSCVFLFCQNSFTLVTFSAVSSLILSLGRYLLKIYVLSYEWPYYAVFPLLLSLSLSSQRFCSTHCSRFFL